MSELALLPASSTSAQNAMLLRSDPTWRRVRIRRSSPQRDDARRVDPDRRAARALGQPSELHYRATRGCDDRGLDLLERSLDLVALPGEQSQLDGIQAIKTLTREHHLCAGRRNGERGLTASPGRRRAVGVGPAGVTEGTTRGRDSQQHTGSRGCGDAVGPEDLHCGGAAEARSDRELADREHRDQLGDRVENRRDRPDPTRPQPAAAI
jgi:hypothetical protein